MPLKVFEKHAFTMRCPTIMISPPTRVTGEHVSVELKSVTFVPVRTVLIGRTADAALEHELFFRHGASKCAGDLTPNV